MNFWASLEYAVGVMIGSCSVIGVVGATYHNHYAQIVMVGISVISMLQVMTFASHKIFPLTSYFGSMEKSDFSFSESSLSVSLEETKNL